MTDSFSSKDEAALDELFKSYKNACPEPEPGAQFMPEIWSRIDSRHSFSFIFGRFSKPLATLSAAACLLLAALNLMSTPQAPPSYADALLSDSSAEQTYFTEAVNPAPVDATPIR